MSLTKLNTKIHLFVLVIIGLLFALPLLINGCLLAHDTWAHLVYAKHFSEQLWQGDLYPRWLYNMNYGLGSPTFFFYAPIPYYFSSLFFPWLNPDHAACNQLSLSCTLALILSGITSYFFLREIVDKNSALLASIIYMIWPYHLEIDLYKRFAFAEYWSFVWMPLILYFTIKLVKGSSLNILGLAISYSCLVLTHLATFIIFFPVPIGYALLIGSRQGWKKVLFRLILAIILMMGLSAIYWFPAMTTQDSISMETIQTKAFFYANNFFFTGPKVEHNKLFWKSLEILTILTGMLAFSSWKISRKHSKVDVIVQSNYWLFVAVLSIFMMLPLSELLWELVPIIQRIQFPWRFNTILTVANTILLALAIDTIKIKRIFFSKENLLKIAVYLFTISLVIVVLQLLATQKKAIFWGSNNTIIIITIIALILVFSTNYKILINSKNKKYLAIICILTTSIFVHSILIMSVSIKALNNENINDILEYSQGAAEHRPQWVPPQIFYQSGEIQYGKNFR
ncbi:MAG TPA: hypothetical protein DCF68_19725, partial [Cyanothece sp. UBA12306]|nr:hypothetical protein [Cyanothece sp. UBA12306]